MRFVLLSVLSVCCISCLGPDYKRGSTGSIAVKPWQEELEGLGGGDRPVEPAGSVQIRPRGSSAGGAGATVWDDPAFRRHLAESYASQTDVEPRLTAAEQKSLQEILGLVGDDRLEEAVTLLASGNNPARSAAFDFTLGNIHFQSDRLDEAASAYVAAVRKFPRFRRAWANLAQVHFRRGDFRNAATAFTKVIELGGGDAVTYGLLGIANTKAENDVAAESAFRMASLMDPKTVDWKLGLAESFFRQQRFADAIALFGSLIAENPDRADLWLAQGEALVRVEQPLRAAENFEMADQLGGAPAASLYNLGDIYSNQELYDLAVGAYARALRKDAHGNPDRILRAARYLSAQGALAEARSLLGGLEGAMGGRLEPSHRKGLLMIRARIAMAEDAGEEEAAILEEVVALDPLDGEALILLGQHASRNGDPEKAVFYFERAAGLEASEADARVRHAQVLVGQGRYAEAVPLLKRAQAIKHRDHIQEFLDKVERFAQAR